MEPFENPVRLSTHDARHFAIQVIEDRGILREFFDIPAKGIDPIDSPPEVTIRLKPFLQRSGATHLQLGNKEGIEKIVRPALQLSRHAGIIAAPPFGTMPTKQFPPPAAEKLSDQQMAIRIRDGKLITSVLNSRNRHQFEPVLTS